MWNDKWSVEDLESLGASELRPGHAHGQIDAATVAGAGISAAGTRAGGGYATTPGQMQKMAE